MHLAQDTSIKPKVIGRPFQPGQVANPLGGKAHHPDTIFLRGLSREQLNKILELVVTKNIDELEALAAERATPALQAIAAKAALRAYYSGDWSFIEGPLSRMLGKVPDRVEISIDVQVREKFKSMSDEQLMAFIDAESDEIRKLLE